MNGGWRLAAAAAAAGEQANPGLCQPLTDAPTLPLPTRHVAQGSGGRRQAGRAPTLQGGRLEQLALQPDGCPHASHSDHGQGTGPRPGFVSWQPVGAKGRR